MWKIIFFPIAYIYRIVTKVRNYLFDNQILKSESFSIPVIAIGNLAVGGTGKTPHVEYLVRLLQNDFEIAILSRGYKRKTKGFLYVMNSSSAFEVGDEPLQFKHKFPELTVVVDEKRAHGIHLIQKENPHINLIILDDAFQHRYVKPSLSILLTEYNKPFYKDYFLPVGRLRDNKKQANRADMIVFTKSPEIIEEDVKQIMSRKIKLVKHQSLHFSKIEYGIIKGVFSNESLTDIINRTIILVTGIANPKPLKNYLSKYSDKIIHLCFSDHHIFSEKDLRKIEKSYYKSENDRPFILFTEKDAMRIKSINNLFIKNLPLFYIPIQVKFLNQKEFNKKVLDTIKNN